MMDTQILLKFTNGQLLHNLLPYCPYLTPQGVFVAGVLFKEKERPAVNLLTAKKETITPLEISSNCRFRFRNEEGMWSDFFYSSQLSCTGNKNTGFQMCPAFQDNHADLRNVSDCMIDLFSIDSGVKPVLSHERIVQILNVYISLLDEYICDDWLMIIHAVRLASEIRKENGSLYLKLLDSLNSKLINTK